MDLTKKINKSSSSKSNKFKPEPGSKTAEKLNLLLAVVEWDNKEKELYVTVDNIRYLLDWDPRNVAITKLFSLPTNTKNPKWRCVEADIRFEKLDKILQHWSPVKEGSKVFIVIHKDRAIITKVKKY